MVDKRVYEGIVEKVYPNGKHGPYAVTREPTLGSVTISLDPTQEEEWPDPGTLVQLFKIRSKRAGYRAGEWQIVGPPDDL